MALTICVWPIDAFSQAAGVDFSRFTHTNPNHSRLPCLLCHRRESNATRPTLPGKDDHAPCKGCHVTQFAQSSGPMCSLCHTYASSGGMKLMTPATSRKVMLAQDI